SRSASSSAARSTSSAPSLTAMEYSRCGARYPRSSPMNLGVIAFGDSITNGGGELQWGVALQSWALWTARGLGLPYTGCAIDGASIDTVVDVEIPLFLR